MRVHIKYFASVREAMGVAGEVVDTTAATAGGLRSELMARPGAGAQALQEGRAVRMALNQSMCDAGASLSEGCELAFFPPVTGG